jgi:hypothetical protein
MKKTRNAGNPSQTRDVKPLTKLGGGVEYRYNVFIRLADVRNIKGEVPGLFT